MHTTVSQDFMNYALSEKGIGTNMLGGYVAGISSYINPAIIEERKLNAVAMDVFSRLMMDRIIFLNESITDDVAGIVQAQLLYLASVDQESEISLYINSPGGSVSAGLAIYDTMQLITPAVSTICTGMAASMGAILLCAGEKGRRLALPHSRIMIHQPLGGVSGQTSDILIEAKEIERCRKELYDIICTHTGQEFDKVSIDADRNFWMSSEEAKEYGMIDDVLTKN